MIVDDCSLDVLHLVQSWQVISKDFLEPGQVLQLSLAVCHALLECIGVLVGLIDVHDSLGVERELWVPKHILLVSVKTAVDLLSSLLQHTPVLLELEFQISSALRLRGITSLLRHSVIRLVVLLLLHDNVKHWKLHSLLWLHL